MKLAHNPEEKGAGHLGETIPCHPNAHSYSLLIRRRALEYGCLAEGHCHTETESHDHGIDDEQCKGPADRGGTDTKGQNEKADAQNRHPAAESPYRGTGRHPGEQRHEGS